MRTTISPKVKNHNVRRETHQIKRRHTYTWYGKRAMWQALQSATARGLRGKEAAQYVKESAQLKDTPDKSVLGRLKKMEAEQFEALPRHQLNVSRIRTPCDPIVEEALVLWVKSRKAEVLSISRKLLCQQPKLICLAQSKSAEETEALTFGRTWFKLFMERNNFAQGKKHGENGGISEKQVADAIQATS